MKSMAVDQHARAHDVWEALILCAEERVTVTYGDLGRLIGIHHRAVMWPLGLIMAIVVAFILLLAPDPYVALGLAFLLCIILPFLCILLWGSRAESMPVAARKG